MFICVCGILGTVDNLNKIICSNITNWKRLSLVLLEYSDEHFTDRYDCCYSRSMVYCDFKVYQSVESDSYLLDSVDFDINCP